MPRFAKKDLPATEAAHFRCKRSFVALDGTLRLAGRDWRDQQLMVLMRDDFKCRKCGTTEPPFDVHHVIHRGKGGSDNLENLILICRRDHDKEHADRAPQWRQGDERTNDGIIR